MAFNVPREEIKARIYPLHGITDNGTVVRFTQESSGEVLESPNRDHRVGYVSHSWNDRCFQETNYPLPVADQTEG